MIFSRQTWEWSGSVPMIPVGDFCFYSYLLLCSRVRPWGVVLNDLFINILNNWGIIFLSSAEQSPLKDFK